MKTKSTLLNLLTHENAPEYFGGALQTKIIALALALNGGNISQAARRAGISRQSMHEQVQRARKLFGIERKAVD